MSNISIQFVEIKCVEFDLTLQTVNTELETTASSFFFLQKIDTNTCVHQVYSVHTGRTMWTHSHVYRVHRGCPLYRWSKNAMLRNPPGESKCSFCCQLHRSDAYCHTLTGHSRVELPSETQTFYSINLQLIA